MTTSDWLAGAALLASLLSALYSRHANAMAKRANAAGLHWQQRPLRVEVFRAMWQFADYCSTYYTLFHAKAVNGTRDLVSLIDAFKWEMIQHGPLEMPEVEKLQAQMISSAWNMQRLIDRIAGGHPETMNSAFESAEDHLQSLIEWFAAERGGLKETFGQYLAAQPKSQ